MTVKEKAGGFIAALDKMTAKEREASPSKAFIEDYNRLRELAAQAMPTKERALPPQLQWQDTESGIGFTDARFVEIHAYAYQIFNLM